MSIKEIKKRCELTNYEMSVILGVSEKTIEDWLSGRRKSRGPSSSLISWFDGILTNGQLTRDELLQKVGRGVPINLEVE